MPESLPDGPRPRPPTAPGAPLGRCSPAQPPRLSRKPVGFRPLHELFLAAEASGLQDGHTAALAAGERGGEPRHPAPRQSLRPGLRSSHGDPGHRGDQALVSAGPGKWLWRPEPSGLVAIRVQGRASAGAARLTPVTPAAPPAAAGHRNLPPSPAPLLARALGCWSRWITWREGLGLGSVQGLLQRFPGADSARRN